MAHYAELAKQARFLLPAAARVGFEEAMRCLLVFDRNLHEVPDLSALAVLGFTSDALPGISRAGGPPTSAIGSSGWHAMVADLNSLGRDLAIGCFPEACLFNHSCQPNATFKLDDRVARENSRRVVPGLVVRVTEDIPEGCEVCISYTEVFASKVERHDHLRGFHFTCDCTRCTLEERTQRSQKDTPYYPLLKALKGVAEGWTDASALWKSVVATHGWNEEDTSFGTAGLRSRATGALVAYFLSNLEEKALSARTRPRPGGPPFDPRYVSSIFRHDLARRRKHLGDRALAQIGYVRVGLALMLLDNQIMNNAEAQKNRDDLVLALLHCTG